MRPDITRIYATWHVHKFTWPDITCKCHASCKLRVMSASWHYTNLHDLYMYRNLRDLNLCKCQVNVNLRVMSWDAVNYVNLSVMSLTRIYATWHYTNLGDLTLHKFCDLTLHEFMRPDITRIYMTWHYTNSGRRNITCNVSVMTLHEFTWPDMYRNLRDLPLRVMYSVLPLHEYTRTCQVHVNSCNLSGRINSCNCLYANLSDLTLRVMYAGHDHEFKCTCQVA